MLIDWAKERDKHDREKVVGYLTAIIGLALKSIELYDQYPSSVSAAFPFCFRIINLHILFTPYSMGAKIFTSVQVSRWSRPRLIILSSTRIERAKVSAKSRRMSAMLFVRYIHTPFSKWCTRLR